MKPVPLLKTFCSTLLFLGLVLFTIPVLAENIRNTMELEGGQSEVYMDRARLFQGGDGEKDGKKSAEEGNEKEQVQQKRVEKNVKGRLALEEEKVAGQHLTFNFLYYLFYKFRLNEFFKSPARRKARS